jgi:hypothetical protein
MNRSESEWAFQRFLQEASAATFDDNTPNSSADKTDVVHINDYGYNNNNATSKSCDNNYKENAMPLSGLCHCCFIVAWCSGGYSCGI